MVEQYTVH